MLYYNEEGVKEAVTLCWISTVIKKQNKWVTEKGRCSHQMTFKIIFWANEDYSYNWLRYLVLKLTLFSSTWKKMQTKLKAIAVFHKRCSLIQQRLTDCLLHERYWEYSSE